MHKNLLLAAFLLLPLPVCLAEVTIHLRNGQDIVAQKVKVSDQMLLVVVNGSLRRIPFAEVSDGFLREMGVDTGKIAAANRPPGELKDATHSGTWQPREASEEIPAKSHETTPKSGANPERKAAPGKVIKRDGTLVAKINRLSELIDAKYMSFKEDSKVFFTNPEQAAQVTASMATDRDKLVSLITALHQGMPRQTWEPIVSSSLGPNSKAQQTALVDGRQFYHATKALYRKEKFILVIHYDKDGTLLNWDCEIRAQ